MRLSAGPGLRIRMAIALIAQLALLCLIAGWSLHVAVTEEDGWSVPVMLVVVTLAGAIADAPERRRRRGRRAGGRDRQEVDGMVQRLCVLADVDPPQIVVEDDVLPLSWTIHRPLGKPRLHVTTGLLDLLGPEETEAVLAHELAHLAHRDAWVMTVVAGPGVYWLRALRQMWRDRRDDFRLYFAAPIWALVTGPPAAVIALIGRVLSRTRELAADEAAARMTGSPAALASALVALSGELARTRRRDLRIAAVQDPFNILPARREEARGLRRLWATHPRLRSRVERLERLERSLQDG